MRQALWLALIVCVRVTTAVAQDRPQSAPSPSPDEKLAEVGAKLGAELGAKAAEGDQHAQQLLGSLNEIAGHFADAASWYRQAAEQGDAIAQGSLGRLYAAGRGVPEDFVQAYRWSRAAADQDDPLGELTLAALNTSGKGRSENAQEAVLWARKAAEQDCALKFRIPSVCAQAQALLGAAYLDGKGVPQDYVLAHMWANLAAATLSVGDLQKGSVDVRDSAARHMTPTQVMEAQRLAREWKPVSAK
jgi:uncharacterized protein